MGRRGNYYFLIDFAFFALSQHYFEAKKGFGMPKWALPEAEVIA